MLARLGITPEQYYDLTGTETAALLKGVDDRELFTLRLERKALTMFRNANFKGSVTESEYMPLPGDDESSGLQLKSQYTDPEVAFMMLGSVMGGELTITNVGYES